MRATRITYVGELGWELYVPTEFAVGVYEDLLATGAELGVRRGGYYAIDSLRLDKGYRAFGRELTPDVGPVEAGLLFACKLRTDVDFLGRDAVEERRRAGPLRRLVSFRVEDPSRCSGAVSSSCATGRAAGQVTSAAWSDTFGCCVGLAWVWDPDGSPVAPAWVDEGQYEVDVAGERHPVTVSRKPLYDEGNERIRN